MTGTAGTGAAATGGAFTGFAVARAVAAARAVTRFASGRFVVLARVRAVFVLPVAFAAGLLTFDFVFTGLAFTDLRVAPALPFGAEVATSDFLTRSDLAVLAFAEPVLPLVGAAPDLDLGFLTAGFDALDLLFFCAVMG